MAIVPPPGSGDENNAPSLYRVKADSDENVQPKTAVVLRFAVESQPASQEMPGVSALSLRACPQINAADASTTTASPSKSLTVDPKILDAISGEMQKRLSKNNFVLVDPNPAVIPWAQWSSAGASPGRKVAMRAPG